MAKRLTLKNKKKNKRTLKRITRSRKIGGAEGVVSLTESAKKKEKEEKEKKEEELKIYIEDSIAKIDKYLKDVNAILKPHRFTPDYKKYINDGKELLNEIKNKLYDKIEILDKSYFTEATTILQKLRSVNTYNDLDQRYTPPKDKDILTEAKTVISELKTAVSKIRGFVGLRDTVYKEDAATQMDKYFNR